MHDREKVISTLEEIKTQTAGIGLDSAVIAHKFIDKIIALLKEDCHNCKLECLLQKYDELKEKYDKLLKEQEAVVAHWDDDTGHWIEGDRDGIDRHTRTTGEMIDTFRCSWCGFYQYWKTPFCPNCGAKMESR